MTQFYPRDNPVRVIPVVAIKKCPALIFWASHYREDNTCRCNEPTCEMEGCTKNKFKPEIFCEDHLIQVMGSEYFYEVYGE